MKVKLLSTTNSGMKELEGKEGILSFTDVAYFTFDATDVSFDFRHGSIRTSLLSSVVFEETSRLCYKITVSTMNSVYIFQKGEESDLEPYTKKEITQLQMALGLGLL